MASAILLCEEARGAASWLDTLRGAGLTPAALDQVRSQLILIAQRLQLRAVRAP